MVEFGRAKNDPIALGYRREQSLDRFGTFLALQILVVKGDRAQIVYLEVSAAGEFLSQCLEYRVRIRTAA